MDLLSVRGLSIHFGGLVALDDVSFDVAEGEICSLIGPNGAGKTTLFNCISRIYTPYRGSITYNGQSLLNRRAHHLASLGVARTFQNLALFPIMSVLQNVMVGSHSRARANFLTSAIPLPALEREECRLRDEAMALLETLGLADKADRPVMDLSYPDLKRVELARALAAKPRLLLLDEPASGLTSEELSEIGGLIRKLQQDRGLTILLVEHHVAMVMSISDRIVVLDSGRIIAVGAPIEIQQNPQVIETYLGSSDETIT